MTTSEVSVGDLSGLMSSVVLVSGLSDLRKSVVVLGTLR